MSTSPLTREAVTAVARSLADSRVCPVCGSHLDSPRCGTCGTDLTGPDAARAWSIGLRASTLLLDRDQVLTRLAPAAASAPAAPPPSTSAPTSVAPTASGGGGPRRPLPSPRPGPTAGRGWRVHEVLVGVGALLLAVAAVGFLFFSWRVLPLAGRAAVVAGVTVTVFGAATWLRTRLRETAEAVAALGIVLLLADAGAVRATGLLGADDVDPLLYAASATAVCAVLIGAWTYFSRLRAGSVAVCLLAPAAVYLFGSWLEIPSATALFVAAATLIRGRLPRAEQWMLRAVAVVALLTALVQTDTLGWLALVLLVAGVISLAQCSAEPASALQSAGVSVRRAWSAAGGLLLSSAAAVAGARIDTWLGYNDLIALLPIVGGAALVVATVGLVRVPNVRPTSLGAGAVTTALATTFLAAAMGIWLTARAAWSATRPWSVDPTVALTTIGPMGDDGTPAWLATTAALALAGAAFLIGSRSGTWIKRVRRPVRWVGEGFLGGAAVVLPLYPQAPVWAVVAGLVGVAVVMAALRRPVFVTAAAVAGTVAVVLAWSTEELSVPVTVIGIAGLLLARRSVARVGFRVALTGAAAAAGLVVAGAVAGLAGADETALRLVWAAAAAAPLVAAALSLPSGDRAAVSVGERLAVTLPGLAVLFAGIVVAEVDGPAWAARLLLGLVLAAALVVVVRSEVAEASTLAAATLAPLTGLLASSFTGRNPLTWAIVAAAWAVPIAFLAHRAEPVPSAGAGSRTDGAAAVVAGARPDDVARGRGGVGRRVAAELGLVASALVALGEVRGGGQLWPVLILLAAGAAVIATAPDRRDVGWATGLLLTGALWTRLAVGGVDLVEAYSLPPALALLALAVYRRRTDRSPDADTDLQRVLLLVAAIAFAPSIAVAGTGSELRPALLLAAAALVTLVPRTGFIGPVAAAATALVRAGWAIAQHPDPSLADVELWTIVAAAILLFHGYRRFEPPTTSWQAFGPGLALLIGPGLWLGVQPGSGTEVRQMLVIALAAAALAVGAWQRLQAAVVLGAGALTVQALVLLAPQIAALRDAVPVWGWLALVGLALLVLGAGYERRLQQVRDLGLRLAAFR